MKRIFLFVVAIACMFFTNEVTMAQVTVTHYTGSVADLIQQYFISDGSVELDNSYGHEAKFNGQTSTTSVQLGTFTNATTTGNNMPLPAGIVMTTGKYDQAGVGNRTDIESGPGHCQDCGSNSPSLYTTYTNQGGTNHMNDVACMSFWIIPKSESLSFSYVFASEEYPTYVCSPYNDIFGFFISGPYDENGNIITTLGDSYTNENIAIIPNTEPGIPVMINSVNNGTLGSSGGSLSSPGCNLSYSQYFITNDNDNCRMNGYTVDLSTKKIEVVPCYRYRIELAIANIGDQAYNSTVYLKANSLRSDKLNLNVTGNNDIDGVYAKGCGRAKVLLSANYDITSNTQYTVQITPSSTSTLTEGEDYVLTDENGQSVGTTLTLSNGQNDAYFYIDFIRNENKAPLTIDTLWIISEYVNECTPRDTIILVCREMEDLTCTVTGGRTYCDNELPQTENITITSQGAEKFMKVTITNSLNEEPFETTVYYDDNASNTLTATYTPIIHDPVEFFVKVEDSCGRVYEQTIEYKIQGANTTASISNNYICEGEEVVLSCPEAVTYTWSAEPMDASLIGQENVREPQVTPKENTKYTITIEDENGCIASDEVDVTVIAHVTARMSLSAHTLTLSSATLIYEDVTINGADRFWDLGDGTTSTAISGTENYPVTDSGTYQIMLIAYDAAGCSDTAYDYVRVVPDFTFYLPNAFVPGDDDQSIGIFAPQGSMLEYYTLDVYNRWGAKIFAGKPNEGWDGKLESGELAPQGTYIYDIFYTDGDGLLQRKTGTFTAIPKKGTY
ncbi:MAG: choice-of-anchor L domain-containing protein [Bacteroidota bacterium]|nr:choice-of-anchor L domain-containing protein [Bacteroidota bacterium]